MGQPAVLHRLEAIFEPVLDEAHFGYRRGRSTRAALRTVWRELEAGYAWVGAADLKDFFGSVDPDKRLGLVNQQVSEGRGLKRLRQRLGAGCEADGRGQATERGPPQGGVRSPLLGNLRWTPFDRERRCRGYRLTRYADDGGISVARAGKPVQRGRELVAFRRSSGGPLNTEKTKLVPVRRGFEFLGYRIKRGRRPLRLGPGQSTSGIRPGSL